MQISASQSYAASSYQQAQPQQNAPVAVAALNAQAPTAAPTDTEAAVRPAVKSFEGRNNVAADDKRDDRRDVANDRGDTPRPQATQGRGQIVDLKA